jgi:hypothetical protein
MQNSNNKQQFDRAMAPEQFEQLIEAILAGKYSWACVLILRFAGYNPLHYIPYRTYNRIIKDNTPKKERRSKSVEATENLEPVSARLHDLSYMEEMPSTASHKVGGGFSKVFSMLDFRK